MNSTKLIIKRKFRAFFCHYTRRSFPLTSRKRVFLTCNLRVRIIKNEDATFNSIMRCNVATNGILLRPISRTFKRPTQDFINRYLPLIAFHKSNRISQRSKMEVRSRTREFIRLSTSELLLFQLITRTRRTKANDSKDLICFNANKGNTYQVRLRNSIIHSR